MRTHARPLEGNSSAFGRDGSNTNREGKDAMQKTTTNLMLALLIGGGFAFCGCESNSGNDSNVVLTAPVLVSPPDGAVFDYYPRTTTVVWEPVSGASEYDVDVWTLLYNGERVPGSDYWDQPVRVKGTSYTFEFDGCQPGKWRARAVKGSNIGPWSEFRGFRYLR